MVFKMLIECRLLSSLLCDLWIVQPDDILGAKACHLAMVCGFLSVSADDHRYESTAYVD